MISNWQKLIKKKLEKGLEILTAKLKERKGGNAKSRSRKAEARQGNLTTDHADDTDGKKRKAIKRI